VADAAIGTYTISCSMENKRIFGHFSNLLRPLRASAVRIKINGRCVNNCVFCPYHSDSHRLGIKDIARFFDMIPTPRFSAVVVNGGEPTIHPGFADICDFLRGRFKKRVKLILGTNMIPLSWSRGRYAGIFDKVLETYDKIEVGCDDEHRNIHLLEAFAPGIVGAGLVVDVNVMADYCSEETRHRILNVQKRYGVDVSFSEIHHYWRSRPVINYVSVPCAKRARHFVLQCNGNGFLCQHQEMEKPLLNLFSVTREDLEYYLNEYDPEPYEFCACCPLYVPDIPMLSNVREALSAFRRLSRKSMVKLRRAGRA
jgi:hypothetical protein